MYRSSPSRIIKFEFLCNAPNKIHFVSAFSSRGVLELSCDEKTLFPFVPSEAKRIFIHLPELAFIKHGRRDSFYLQEIYLQV